MQIVSDDGVIRYDHRRTLEKSTALLPFPLSVYELLIQLCLKIPTACATFHSMDDW